MVFNTRCTAQRSFVCDRRCVNVSGGEEAEVFVVCYAANCFVGIPGESSEAFESILIAILKNPVFHTPVQWLHRRREIEMSLVVYCMDFIRYPYRPVAVPHTTVVG